MGYSAWPPHLGGHVRQVLEASRAWSFTWHLSAPFYPQSKDSHKEEPRLLPLHEGRCHLQLSCYGKAWKSSEPGRAQPALAGSLEAL